MMSPGTALSGLLALATMAAPARGASPACEDPATEIRAAFATHDVVLLSEEHYGVQFHAFLRALVADPRLAGVVQDIGVEFGNPLYQAAVDRYVGGETVDRADLRKAWRNTTQLIVWDSPLYEDFFTWMRTVNSGLPREKQFRVVLLDPPIDWERVRTRDDYAPFARRSPEQLHAVETEILARKRKALVVIGGMHVLRRSASAAFKVQPIENAGLGEALGARYPGRTYAIWTVPAGAPLPNRCPPNRITPVVASIAKASFGEVAPHGIMVRAGAGEWRELSPGAWPPMVGLADALLELGSDRTRAEPNPATFADDAYYRELQRRARILQDVFGMDFLSELATAAKRTERAQ